MKKYISKWVLAVGFAATLLSGCGGGDNGGGGGVAGGSCPQTFAATEVVNFIQDRIIPIGENKEPLDLSCTTLATDEILLPQIL